VRRLALLAAIAAIATAVAACGVPNDSDPRRLDAQNVPFELLGPTTTTTVPAAGPTREVTIFLAQEEGLLAEVTREVEAPASLRKALHALLAGPLAEESSLSTAITTETTLLHLRGPVDGLVTIDLSREMLDVTGRQQILALAQVVYTATAYPGVERVLFQFDGEPREVPNGEGTLTSTPLGRLSYRGLTEPAKVPSTTSEGTTTG
jgi:spore germination protein GerM